MTLATHPGEREQRLLLNCARVRMDPALDTETSAILEQPLDWESVLFLARLHSIASLLHRHIGRLDAGRRVPERIRLRLLQLAHRTAYQNRIFSQENVRIVTALDAAAVPSLIQKGLSVAELVYGSLLLRPLIDLVYLVRAEDVPSARRVLKAEGYSERPTPPIEGFYRWCCPQLHLVRQAEMRVAVLLQWNLVNWPRLHRWHPAAVWQRARPAEIAGRQVLVLSPVDLVIYLCLQLDNQGFFNRVAADRDPVSLLFARWTNNRLVRFVDIHQAIERFGEEIDWDEVVGRARESGVDGAVLTSLSLTTSLLGTRIAERVRDLLRATPSGGVRRWLFFAIQEEARPASPIARAVRARWHRSSARQQLRGMCFVSLAELAFPGRRRIAAHYGISTPAGGAAASVLHAVHALTRSVVTSGLLILRKGVRRLGLSTRLFDMGWSAPWSPPAR